MLCELCERRSNTLCELCERRSDMLCELHEVSFQKPSLHTLSPKLASLLSLNVRLEELPMLAPTVKIWGIYYAGAHRD